MKLSSVYMDPKTFYVVAYATGRGDWELCDAIFTRRRIAQDFIHNNKHLFTKLKIVKMKIE